MNTFCRNLVRVTARSVVGCLLFAGCQLIAGCQPTSQDKVDGDSASETAEQAVPLDRAAEIRNGERMAKSGDLSAAAVIFRRVLLTDPNDVETLFRLANVEAKLGDLPEAISLLDSISPDDPEAGLAALGQSADWCLELNRYQDAESRYRKVLARAPDAAIAIRQLAYLLNRQGRRHEAATYLQQLCRLGDVQENELHALLSLSDAVYDDPKQNTNLEPGAMPYWPIGPVGEARYLFTQRLYPEAAALLHDFVQAEPVDPAVNAFYGRALAEAQDEERFLLWLAKADAPTKEFAEFWGAVGAYLVEHQRFEEAVRALGESLRRDGTDARSFRRMNQALVALGHTEAAKKWFDRSVTVREVALASNRIGETKGQDESAFRELIQGLIVLGRPLESVMWQWIEAYYRNQPKEVFVELNRQQVAIAGSPNAFDDDVDRLCGLDLAMYRMPTWETWPKKLTLDTSVTPAEPVESVIPPSFENVAESIGLTHSYQVAAQTQNRGFAIYQQIGGGVAVLDYDLDGAVDLYFAQGGSDPPSFVGTQSDLLYRTTNGKLLDVTGPAGATERRYSIGLTSGDWNQDGFPDLVVGNLGANLVLINQGDGTFSQQATDDSNSVSVMTTSLAMADVTGDAIPDIVELNYADDPNLPQKPIIRDDGIVNVVSPLEYQPAMDRLHINDGMGGRNTIPISESLNAKATGLGIVVTDFDGDVGNEIFVGNDLRPNQLWKRDATTRFNNIAPTSGCALGGGGATVASMGIAASDFDRSGTIDLFITNFENEAACLFLNRGRTFQDRCVQYKLAADSYAVLGFGCQPLDYNNDGAIDLVVTNGHVENTGNANQPFEQPAQIFANYGDHFRLMDVNDRSNYFQSKHVGRALARLDFNQDGRPDYVVTHLNAASSLLLNRTDSSNHWLGIQLVGTSCERDAIGAKVQVFAGNNVLSQWVTGGDGYLCHNESQVSFGLGNSTMVDKILVTWPDGSQQHFTEIASNQSVVLIESQSDFFSLPPLN